MFISGCNRTFRDSLFLGYCKHQQECEDIIKRIAAGDTAISLDDDFTQDELEYMEKVLLDNYGIEANLTIS